jgi:aminoglycoside phosphotransferase (APT) family kinase protein
LSDKLTDVRAGEEIDAAAVGAWLAERVGVVGVPEVRQFSGGASNLTYLLSWPGKDLVLRRAPPGHKSKGSHDMLREARLQAALRPVFPLTPTIVAVCGDPAVLGCDFYVMERIEGLIPRRDLPPELELDEAATRRLCCDVLDKLVELHCIDVKAAGLSDLGRGRGYVSRQVEGWNRRYANCRTWNTPGWAGVTRWLADNQPDDVATVLVHNDFRFDNIVLAPEPPHAVVGVLDWELATLGDPLMDLGNALAYWIQADDDFVGHSARRQPSQVIDYYADKTGRDLQDFRFYLVQGLFRLAVIAQQIYYRYHHKQTRNPAFRSFWFFNHYLHWRARRAIRGHV